MLREFKYALVTAVLFSSSAVLAAGHRNNANPDVPHADSPSAELNRLEPAVLPIVAANSDIGFVFGALTFLTRLHPDWRPYRHQLQAQFLMSVKNGPDGTEFPIHDHFLKLDFPQLGDGRIRLYTKAAFRRNIIAGWYGFGNDSKAPPSDLTRRYQYRYQMPMCDLISRIDIWRQLSIFAAVRFLYADIDTYEGSKLAEDILSANAGTGSPLHGTDNHARLEMQTGAIWDTRDHETNPQQGAFYELSVRASPGELSGAGHNYLGLNISSRHFFSIFGQYLVVGVHLVGDLLMGKVPFYELARTTGFDAYDALGGFKGVRGVPARRYSGKVKFLGHFELRSVIHRFKVKSQHFGLGASVFFDAGRLWQSAVRHSPLDGDGPGIKWGAGGGPQILWGEAVVIRFDVACSPDANPVGFYIEAGRAF